jgi:hypothetical protein
MALAVLILSFVLLLHRLVDECEGKTQLGLSNIYILLTQGVRLDFSAAPRILTTILGLRQPQ